MPTLTQAYKDAGYTLRSPRNQWSAQKDDGSGVALSVWSDEIDKSAEPWVIDTHGHPGFDVWGKRPGHTMRKKHIAYALAHLGGRCDLILCVVTDPSMEPRKVKDARHWPQRVGQLDADRFDPETGHFRLKLRPSSDG